MVFHGLPKIPWNSMEFCGILSPHSHTLIFVFVPLFRLSNTLFDRFNRLLHGFSSIYTCTVGWNPEGLCRACPSHIYLALWSVRATDVSLCPIGTDHVIQCHIARAPQGSKPSPHPPSIWPPAAGRRPRTPQEPPTNPPRPPRRPNRPDRARTRTPTTRALNNALTLQNGKSPSSNHLQIVSNTIL